MWLDNFYHWFLALPDNLRAHAWSYECSSTTCPGFDVLQGLLIRHSHLPQVYEALAALLLGNKTSHTAEGKVSKFSSCKPPSSSISIIVLHCASSPGAFGWCPTVTDWQPSRHSCSAALCWSCYNTAGISQMHHYSGNIVITAHLLSIIHHQLIMCKTFFYVLTAYSSNKAHVRHWCIMGDSAPSKYDAVPLSTP